MRAALLIFVFALAFLAGAVARFPLSAALSLGGARAEGLDWRAAEGTVWSGRVRGLTVRDYPLGDASLSLSPLSLLTLSPAADVALAGPEANGRARIVLTPGGAARLSDGQASLRLSELTAIDARLRARGGSLTARDVEIAFRDGRCTQARGALQTDALTYGFGGDWRGPVLDGAMACDNGVLVMALTGADEAQEVEARAMLGRGETRVEAAVRSDDPALARIAPLIGFTPYGEGWRYQRSFGE